MLLYDLPFILLLTFHLSFIYQLLPLLPFRLIIFDGSPPLIILPGAQTLVHMPINYLTKHSKTWFHVSLIFIDIAHLTFTKKTQGKSGHAGL